MKATYTLNSHKIGGGSILVTLRSATEVKEAEKIVNYITTNYPFEVTNKTQNTINLDSSSYQCYQKSELVKIYKEAKKSLIVTDPEEEFKKMMSKRY